MMTRNLKPAGLERIESQLDRIERLITQPRKENQWFTLHETSKYAGISESTIRRAVNKGELKVSRTTGRLLFKISKIEEWLNG